MLCLVSAAVTRMLIHDHESPVFRGPIAQTSAGVFSGTSPFGLYSY